MEEAHGSCVVSCKVSRRRGVDYEIVPHERTLRSSTTAEASGIPEDNLAKGVLIRRRAGYMLVIVPASHHVGAYRARGLGSTSPSGSPLSRKSRPCSATASLALCRRWPALMD